MKNFCIISNGLKDKDYEVTKEIRDIIENNAGKTIIIKKGLEHQDKELIMVQNAINEAEFDIEGVIVLGGDGTMLQVAKDMYTYDIPVIGINLGTMGFLTEIEKNDIRETIDLIMSDKYTIQERIMVTGTIMSEGKEVFNDVALNDIVIGRYGLSRVMSVEVYVNDELINVYHGDGILVSTPTGTTGYNLSAGGPIAIPDAKLLVITPICVHSLYSRSIIVSEQDEVRIKVKEERSLGHIEAMATFDGRAGFKLKENDEIIISRAHKTTNFIKTCDKKFFDIVRDKIEITRK